MITVILHHYNLVIDYPSSCSTVTRRTFQIQFTFFNSMLIKYKTTTYVFKTSTFRHSNEIRVDKHSNWFIVTNYSAYIQLRGTGL
jgi:hypothetical protein